MQLRENYKVRADRDHKICNNQLDRFGQIQQKIDKYKTERNDTATIWTVFKNAKDFKDTPEDKAKLAEQIAFQKETGQYYGYWKKAKLADADGIYLIVNGMARISNPYDKYSFGDQKLVTGDYFGSSKYVLSQGFSYFGDIIACPKEQVQNLKVEPGKQRQLKNQMSTVITKRTASTGTGTNKNKKSEKDTTAGQESQKKE